MDKKIYEFQDYLLDVGEQRLQKNGEDISLPPKVFEVLRVLIENHGELVVYDKIMDEVWKDTFVEDTNLRYCIHFLRKSFEDNDFIETVPKSGYRFKTEVAEYTKEEFIRKHTGSYKLSELTEPQNSFEIPQERQKSVSLNKYRTLLIFAGIIVIFAGFLGFYFLNKEAQTSDESVRTIAVVPFEMIGADFSEKTEKQNGFMDALNFNLGKIKDLQIVSDEKLADFVLSGSYRIEGEQIVRINAKVSQNKSGETLSTQTFTLKADDQIEIEQTASLRISREIYNKLATIEDEKFVRAQNISKETQEKYILGQQILRNFDLFRRDEGVRLFKEITEAEPNWAKGFAKYAEALVMLHGNVADRTVLLDAINKSLEMDENQPETYIAKAWYHAFGFEWSEAEQSLIKAIEINPQIAEPYHEYALILDYQRKFSEAEKMYKKAMEIKPFDPFYFSNLCSHYYYDDKLDLATENCQKALNIEDNFSPASKTLYWVYVESGDYRRVFEFEYGGWTDEEIEKDRIAKPLKGGDIKLYWQRVIEFRLNDKKRRQSPLAIANLYAQLEDKENTLKYLEQVAEVEPIDMFFVNPGPSYDFIRKEPRFMDLMKRFNLAP